MWLIGSGPTDYSKKRCFKLIDASKYAARKNQPILAGVLLALAGYDLKTAKTFTNIEKPKLWNVHQILKAAKYAEKERLYPLATILVAIASNQMDAALKEINNAGN